LSRSHHAYVTIQRRARLDRPQTVIKQ
jgi:hypothetical protein